MILFIRIMTYIIQFIHILNINHQPHHTKKIWFPSKSESSKSKEKVNRLAMQEWEWIERYVIIFVINIKLNCHNFIDDINIMIKPWDFLTSTNTCGNTLFAQYACLMKSAYRKCIIISHNFDTRYIILNLWIKKVHCSFQKSDFYM